MSNSQQTITKWSFLKFTLLPQLRPRFGKLFGTGFQYVPYFIALVYQCVRLLPKNHPYVMSQNIGRFGVRQVIAEAANNLTIRRENIDQLLLFAMILIGMVIVCLQLFLVGLSLFIQPSFSAAFPINFNEFFVTGATTTGAYNPAQDIAYVLLDMVFGVPGMFGSCVDDTIATGIACQDINGNDVLIATGHPTLSGVAYEDFAAWPYPVHAGLHQLFALYSYGLLIVAVFITLYFMVTIVAETAQSGMAFGKRFNKVWAPVRIVVAFGLLMPIAYGLNSGQYIVLYAAKYGSGFATNGWQYFNSHMLGHYHKDSRDLVSEPQQPEFANLLQFFYTAAVCKTMYEAEDGIPIDMYLVREGTGASSFQGVGLGGLATPDNATVIATTSYDDLITNWSKGENRILIRFGHRDTNLYSTSLGSVKPFCGEIVFELQDPRTPPVNQELGPYAVQRFYWFIIKKLWFNHGFAKDAAAANNERYDLRQAYKSITGLDDPAITAIAAPDENWRTDNIGLINGYFKDLMTGAGGPDPAQTSGAATPAVTSCMQTTPAAAATPAADINAIDALLDSASWNMSQTLCERGWAGAAIWYNRIAHLNGAVTSAVFKIPTISNYPYLMEHVSESKRQNAQETQTADRFNPSIVGHDINYPDDPGRDPEKAQGMYEAHHFWQSAGNSTSVATEPTGNIFIDTISNIFGANGLFEMRKNSNVHPLAQLVGIGKGLVETSIRNLGAAAVGSLASTLGGAPGQAGEVMASFMVSIAMLSLTMGFVLFYIVPFLPFIYFFFAVGGWIKGIFEAMVGVPLWALAHIRIDGNGLPGQAAMSGYFLILEIFLRPILIIFGFFASILIFTALVEALNNMFDLITSNLTGFDMEEETSGGSGIFQIDVYRNEVDMFFFTIIYAILVYMMAQSSFKLIDLIPNNILRWMGQSISTFNDSREDAAEGLSSKAQMGAQQAIGSIGGGAKGLISQVGKIGG